MKYKIIIILLIIINTTLFSVDIIDIFATSTLPTTAKSDYSAEMLIDKTWRSWSEGEAGDGVGTKITISLLEKTRITWLLIKNGYGDQRYFLHNNRVKSLKILDSSNNYNIVDLADTLFPQIITLDTPLK